MARLSLKACRGLTYRYMLREGWLPPGTAPNAWSSVTIAELLIDDPPLPGDPHFQKRRVALDLQSLYYALGGTLTDPFAQLKQGALTLGEFAVWCQANHA